MYLFLFFYFILSSLKIVYLKMHLLQRDRKINIYVINKQGENRKIHSNINYTSIFCSYENCKMTETNKVKLIIYIHIST